MAQPKRQKAKQDNTFKQVRSTEQDTIQAKVSKQQPANESAEVKYSTIRRLLGTLDRFLTKKFALILAVCATLIAACSAGLFINNSAVNAASDLPSTGGDIALNTWFWAGIALFAFVAVLSTVYFLSRRASIKK